MDDIALLNQVKPFDILTVSETWLNPDISDSEVSLPVYTLARHDRSEKRGGGTAIFIRDGIPYKHRTDLIDSTAETCWIEINRPKCKKLFVCCAYTPPDYSCDSFVDHLNISLAKLPPETEVIALGDFNVNFLVKRGDPAQRPKQKLQRFAEMNDLNQLINTRISDQTRTAIDLIFVNNNHRIVESGTIASTISDHCIVYCTMKSGVPKAPPKTLEFEYRSYPTYDKNNFARDLGAI